MCKFVVSFYLALFANAGISQEVEHIVTDRPDQTESPFLVLATHWQIETGFYEQRQSETENNHEWIIPNTLVKYGISKNLELRLVAEGSINIQHNAPSNKYKLNPIDLGFKARLWEENGIIPKTSLIVHSTLPQFWLDVNPYWGGSFRFTMQHTLSDKWSLGYNLGGELQKETDIKNGIYTFVIGRSLLPNLGFYIETYGNFTHKDGLENHFDGGITWTPKPNILIDLSYGKSRIGKNYDFIGAGFSIRLPN